MISFQASHKEGQARYENSLQEKEYKILAAQKTIRDKDAQIDQIKTQLLGKDHEIDLQKQIEAQRKESELESQKSLQSQENSVRKYKEQLKAQKAENATMKESMQELEMKL